MGKIFSALIAVLFIVSIMPTTFAEVPGTAPGADMPEKARFSVLSVGNSLAPVVSETGKVYLSIDAMGTTGSAGTIQVEKPAGATVRSAYLATATTGFSSLTLIDGDIAIDGNGVTFSSSLANSISSYNYWADVTAIVKPIVDSAPAGRVDLTISYPNRKNTDGEVLAVIFDDPNQPKDNTVLLFFGAQDVNGDTFSIGLADPVDKGIDGLTMDMSLGISFGYQPAGQYSQVDVNGIRMTTSAGGQDDGDGANGALVTAGGLDDSNANPIDPYATDSQGPRYDDELYNILPFVEDGDTSISVYTLNPSNDDNIFFAALYLTSTTAIVGEGILLSPTEAWNPLNTEHTVTAKIQDAAGAPVSGVTVMFEVVEGPNKGVTGMDETDEKGEASFTYSSGVSGTDVIVASFYNEEKELVSSNRVVKNWGEDDEPENNIPEFGFLGASLVLLAAAIFIMRRR